jgi:hypothetical protein
MTSHRGSIQPVPIQPRHRRTWRSFWRRCTCGLTAPCVDRHLPSTDQPWPPQTPASQPPTGDDDNRPSRDEADSTVPIRGDQSGSTGRRPSSPTPADVLRLPAGRTEATIQDGVKDRRLLLLPATGDPVAVPRHSLARGPFTFPGRTLDRDSTVAPRPALNRSLTAAPRPALNRSLAVPPRPALTPGLAVAPRPALNRSLAVPPRPALTPGLAVAPRPAPYRSLVVGPRSASNRGSAFDSGRAANRGRAYLGRAGNHGHAARLGRVGGNRPTPLFGRSINRSLSAVAGRAVDRNRGLASAPACPAGIAARSPAGGRRRRLSGAVLRQAWPVQA